MAISPADTDSGCRERLCEGTQIVEVAADSDFSGVATLETSCRDEAFAIRPGESVLLTREEDAEDCGVTL